MKTTDFEYDGIFASDYGFMVIHIFTKEGREYYDLDKLWNEAKEIKFNK